VQEFQKNSRSPKWQQVKDDIFISYQKLGLDIIETLNYDQKMQVEMSFVKRKNYS